MPDPILNQQPMGQTDLPQTTNPPPAQVEPTQSAQPTPVAMPAMPPQPVSETFFNKYKWPLFVLFAILVIGGAGLLGYVLSQRKGSSPVANEGAQVQTPNNQAATNGNTDQAAQNANGTQTAQTGAPEGSASNVPSAAQDNTVNSGASGVLSGQDVPASSGGGGSAPAPAGEVPAGSAPDADSSNPIVPGSVVSPVSVPDKPSINIQPAAQGDIQVQIPAQQPVVNAPLQNLLSSGSVTAILDATSARKQLVTGSSAYEVAKYKLTAVGESFKITDVTLSLVDEYTPKSITWIILQYDGGLVYKKQLALTEVSKNLIKVSGLNLSLAAGETKVLSVGYQLAPVIDEKMSGKNVKTSLYGMKGTDTKNHSLSYSKVVAGNSIYVYKTVPTVASVDLPRTLLQKGRNIVTKFSITNNGATNLKWNKVSITFKCKFDLLYCGLSSGNPIIKTDGLYNLEVMGPGIALGEERQDLLANGFEFNRVAVINGITKSIPLDGTWEFKHYTGGTVVGTFTAAREEEVVAGFTRNFSVSANVLLEPIVGDFVSAKWANPSSVIVSSADTGPSAMNSNASFVWSDLSATAHSVDSGDWHNDYLVRYLPLATQTLKK